MQNDLATVLAIPIPARDNEKLHKQFQASCRVDVACRSTREAYSLGIVEWKTVRREECSDWVGRFLDEGINPKHNCILGFSSNSGIGNAQGREQRIESA
ncbi:MAG: hypothetical protein ABSD72_12900 [Terracidiphilus sp.]|jgi:hypothetical protein